MTRYESSDKPFVVAVTGGIASGKTTVSDMFSDLGVPVIDTDVISRELTSPGSPVLTEIALELGSNVLETDGSLNRKTLRQMIFSDPEKRLTLESIIHPPILKKCKELIDSVVFPYCIVVIPLITEIGVPDFVDHVLVIDTDEQTQIERVMKRDSVTEKEAIATLAAQARRGVRLGIADDVILNNGNVTDLRQHVVKLHQTYLLAP